MISLRDHRNVPADTGDPSPLDGVRGKIALAYLSPIDASTVCRRSEKGWIRICKRGSGLADVETLFEDAPENERGTRCAAAG
jgi:hypothetical protein